MNSTNSYKMIAEQITFTMLAHVYPKLYEGCVVVVALCYSPL